MAPLPGQAHLSLPVTRGRKHRARGPARGSEDALPIQGRHSPSHDVGGARLLLPPRPAVPQTEASVPGPPDGGGDRGGHVADSVPGRAASRRPRPRHRFHGLGWREGKVVAHLGVRSILEEEIKQERFLLSFHSSSQPGIYLFFFKFP